MQLGLDGLHHGAHVFGCGLLARCSSDFGEGFSDKSLKGGFVEGFGQELLDDNDLCGFSGGKFGAIALGELVDGVAPLLDHGGQGLLLLGRG